MTTFFQIELKEIRQAIACEEDEEKRKLLEEEEIALQAALHCKTFAEAISYKNKRQGRNKSINI